ncbi:unannotated protein [freshwater metagenome]|uniref:Unannotated protein n=1 Tax=freshwater metagenome TaxID=449393 RepID=A0A6J6M690_9ZZZZ
MVSLIGSGLPLSLPLRAPRPLASTPQLLRCPQIMRGRQLRLPPLPLIDPLHSLGLRPRPVVALQALRMVGSSPDTPLNIRRVLISPRTQLWLRLTSVQAHPLLLMVWQTERSITSAFVRSARLALDILQSLRQRRMECRRLHLGSPRLPVSKESISRGRHRLTTAARQFWVMQLKQQSITAETIGRLIADALIHMPPSLHLIPEPRILATQFRD